MGRATAVLGRRRVASLAALLAGLVAWDALSSELPALRNGLDLALVAVVLVPASLSVIWLLLPVANERALWAVALALGALCVLLDVAGLEAAFNVTKLVALAVAGFWFLRLFDTLALIVLVAVVIPWADIASVYRGPTQVIVEEQPGLFERIAVGFPLPGEDAAAQIGPPDIFFFALFLAAAARFGLRVGATWVGMTAGLGVTLVATDVLDVNGLPALPGIALGFLLPSCDLLWRALRSRETPAEQRSSD